VIRAGQTHLNSFSASELVYELICRARPLENIFQTRRFSLEGMFATQLQVRVTLNWIAKLVEMGQGSNLCTRKIKMRLPW
jgi:hypothetical protein